MDGLTKTQQQIDLTVSLGDSVKVTIAPGTWYQLRGTDAQIMLPNGAAIHLLYRKTPEEAPINGSVGASESPATASGDKTSPRRTETSGS